MDSNTMYKIEQSAFFLAFITNNYLKNKNLLENLEYAVIIEKPLFLFVERNAWKEFEPILKKVNQNLIKKLLFFSTSKELHNLMKRNMKEMI